MSSRTAAGNCVVVMGATGMLGRAVARRLRNQQGPISIQTLWTFNSRELDVRDGDAVLGAILAIEPSLVINCAAYTDVDGAELHPAEAMAVNAHGAGHLARACARAGARLLHVSTDFVFDGSLRRPYRPADMGRPVSAYGRSKWEGEVAIRGTGCRHLIVRTSWLFGPGGRNFVDAIAARALSGEPLRVVCDQIGRPTYTEDLADAIVLLAAADAESTIHFANSGSCSWFEFAEAIVEESGAIVPVEAIRSAELHRAARRPVYSVLDLSGYIAETGETPPPWRNALARYLSGRRREDRSAALEMHA